MYILAAASQLNCLIASGTRQMKVRPADLLRLQGWLHCKWQRPPLHCGSLKWSWRRRGAPQPEPRAAGTLTSSNDLQPPEQLHISSHVHFDCSIKRKVTSCCDQGDVRGKRNNHSMCFELFHSFCARLSKTEIWKDFLQKKELVLSKILTQTCYDLPPSP